MIHQLFGKIVQHEAEHIVLRSGDIEWSIATNERCQQTLLSHGQEKVGVYTHLHLRQDSLTLFGFSSFLARTTFLLLITVDGIGPRHAQRILSSLDPIQVWRGIEQTRVETFSGVGGLGRKRIEKLFITLRDKVPTLPEGEPSDFQSQSIRDIIEGMVTMGYQREFVQKSLRRLEKQEDIASLKEEELFKRLLEILGNDYS